MEVRVLECIAGTVVEDSGATPFLVIFDICRMGLLTKTLIYILLSVADLRPAIVSLDLRSGISVDHRHNLFGCLKRDFLICHLHHLLYIGFDEVDFFFAQAVLAIELEINLMNRLCPVDIG